MLPEILDDAIRKAQLGRLQSLIRDICEESSVARELFEAHLLCAPASKPTAKSNTKRKRIREEDGNEDEEKPSKAGTKKQRNFLRYAECEHCDQEYDTLDNDEESCVWHEGELECDYEHKGWATWDYRWPAIDDEENQSEFPERFQWTCCGEDGTDDGCRWGKHMPNVYFKNCVTDDGPQIKKKKDQGSAEKPKRIALPGESDMWSTFFFSPLGAQKG